MPTAYTPGLRITEDALIRKERRLPLKGQVLVSPGDLVEAETVVAKAELPGTARTIKAAEVLGIEPSELPGVLAKKVGDPVEEGELLGEVKTFFGLFKSQLRAPTTGTIEHISEVSGYVGVREPPIPIQIEAYLAGRVAEIIPEEGVIIESRGALIEGIFGVGGERRGNLAMVASAPDQPLSEEALTDQLRGQVIVGGSTASGAALQKAAKCGVTGVILGGISDSDLQQLVGYEIGVAITGHEDIPFTLIVTEGFGPLSMAQRTFDLLKSLEGQMASINGATQIRAGVIRPEIIVPKPMEAGAWEAPEKLPQTELGIGTRVRVIREPHFGRLGKITALPSELQPIETGAQVRVAEVELDDAQTATVPRANLEIIEW